MTWRVKENVDNPGNEVKKWCRKKNFFPNQFALYFASLTDGHIPLTKK